MGGVVSGGGGRLRFLVSCRAKKIGSFFGMGLEWSGWWIKRQQEGNGGKSFIFFFLSFSVDGWTEAFRFVIEMVV